MVLRTFQMGTSQLASGAVLDVGLVKRLLELLVASMLSVIVSWNDLANNCSTALLESLGRESNSRNSSVYASSGRSCSRW